MTNNGEQRDKRRADLALALRAHRRAEDDRDVDAIMVTFAPDAVMEVNGRPVGGPAEIRAFHEQLGFAPGGALADLDISEDRQSFTDDEVILEGYARGVHSGEFMGIPPSGRTVTMPYCAIYRFDDGGKLAHERVYIDVTPLVGG